MNPPTEGLLLWLRADRGVNESSGQVAVWEDQSGHNLDATQNVASARPRLARTAIGSRPAIVFDGVDDFMHLPQGFADFSRGVSAFATIELASSSNCMAVFELSNGSEIDDISFGHFETRLLYEVLDSFVQGAVIPLSTPQLVASIHRPSTTVDLRQNGNRTNGSTMNLPAGVTRRQNFVGRSLYSGCAVFDGSIAEILLYDRAVTNAEVTTIETYMRRTN